MIYDQQIQLIKEEIQQLQLKWFKHLKLESELCKHEFADSRKIKDRIDYHIQKRQEIFRRVNTLSNEIGRLICLSILSDFDDITEPRTYASEYENGISEKRCFGDWE